MHAAGERAHRLELRVDTPVREYGAAGGVDEQLRAELAAHLGAELAAPAPEAALVWLRAEDAPPIDLREVAAALPPYAPIWALTPKPGYRGHVPAGALVETADRYELVITDHTGISEGWTATCMRRPRAAAGS
ncbi:DUF3052 family protein [Nocardia harenae]|uniref:DUF3052 family protein n=1 Tax=Nocardia harenae TaxID=358707 RepID=UPI0008356724|nr:DUF3052 family protein [Nocardia harenae]